MNESDYGYVKNLLVGKSFVVNYGDISIACDYGLKGGDYSCELVMEIDEKDKVLKVVSERFFK